MNELNLTPVQLSKFQKLKQNYQINKPKYLQTAGYVGIGLTAASGVYMGYKLPKAIARAKSEIDEDDGKLKRFWKYFKRIAPVCAPTVICAVGTGLSFHGAYKEQGRRLAAVGAAYASAIAELDVLKAKMEEVGGKKVAEKVKHAVKEEEVKKADLTKDKEKLEEQRNTSPNSVMYDGSKLPYYDPYLQKIIWATPEDMLRIQAKMAASIESSFENQIDMSIFYEELGFGGSNDKKMPMYASDYGWKAQSKYDLDRCKNNIDRAFFTTTETVSHEGFPCKYIDFHDGAVLRMHSLYVEVPF
ncbi:MAG: hypothetical protein J6Y02_02510 [Pseudobutyrivibrio sp.]|nr:hypothetical protein [Pseudobutyrivibrio sp.]